MADDVTIAAGTVSGAPGGTVIATDDVGGSHYQRFKLDLGGNGATSPLVRGQQADAASIPVTLSTEQAAFIDGLETLLTAIQTAVEAVQAAVEGTLAVSNAGLTELAAAIDTQVQVDVVAALPAGTNAIGKLAANSGVDIGDVDVTSQVASSFDHGSNRDVDTTAEQITSSSIAAKFGVTVRAAPGNSGVVYVGSSDVTAGTTDATDGFPLQAGESITLPVNNANLVYVIGSAANQIVYWVAV